MLKCALMALVLLKVVYPFLLPLFLVYFLLFIDICKYSASSLLLIHSFMAVPSVHYVNVMPIIY